MKKLYTRQFFIAIFALLCSVTATAHDFEVDGIYYNVTDEANLTVEVTFKGEGSYSYDDEYIGSVVIPASVNYNGKNYSVTGIGVGAFQYCSGLTSITIPNSVTSIGEDAFSYCTSLTSVTIPNSVTSIGEEAFYGCSGLTSVTIPNSVTSIGYYAFQSCTGLTSITIPNSVTSIGNYSFEGCTGLESVTIPNSVTSIGESAFAGCSGLTSITIPNSVTSIGEGAFHYCDGLKSIVVEEGNKKYDSRNNCNAIIETETNTLIKGCNTTVIPEDVTSIGGFAFDGCTGLRSVTIPNSVTSIGWRAFRGCTGLTSITIPNSVTSIGVGAFEDCDGLTSITIPNSVTSIGVYAFRGCTGLTSVTIPNSVTSIEYGAFYGCDGLTSVTIGNGVTSIGESAFAYCDSLTSITIGNGVTSIGKDAYKDCKNLTNIIIEEGNTKYDSRDNCNAIIETKTNTLVMGCKNTTIPNSVTSIGEEAFYDCDGLTSVTIPNSVTSIGEKAFYDCDGLTSVTIGNGVTSIGESAFYGCENLKTVINFSNIMLNKGYDYYGYIVYYADKVINIPNGFIERDFIFKEAEGVKTLCEYIGSDTVIVLPDNCKGENYTIGDKLFYKNNITSVEIPNSATIIGVSAFYGCDGLTSVTIGNGVTIIDVSAFYGCKGLTSITIPNSVTNIKYSAFSGCEGLTSIYMLSGTPAVVSTLTFSSSSYKNTTLYVPQGSLEAYKAATGWKDFENIVEFDATGIEDVTEDAPAFEITDSGVALKNSEGKAVAVYTAGGALVEKIDSYTGEEIMLDKGVYIIKVGNKSIKVKL